MHPTKAICISTSKTPPSSTAFHYQFCFNFCLSVQSSFCFVVIIILYSVSIICFSICVIYVVCLILTHLSLYFQFKFLLSFVYLISVYI
ncbi:hypothetical protein J437_LFUL018919 [Ladona fulva]|uniref:Uncharacterized protein n=1 Tax=Ladona fulva TaxID=123851 RepID=A0A8K0KRH4_LADFU|nr:hypothetical protein J437_LFUL018919 [Ladona fulva]